MDTSDAAHSLVIRDPLCHTPGIRVLVLLFTRLSLMERTTAVGWRSTSSILVAANNKKENCYEEACKHTKSLEN